MTDQLRAFLQSWVDWVDAGAPDWQLYSRRVGLCTSSAQYATSKGLSPLRPEMILLFRADGLLMGYPFGEDEYENSAEGGSMHLDPNRLAWVRSKLA